MIKNYVLLAFFLGNIWSGIAQTIRLDFPYFKGQTYDFNLFQGDKIITLQKGTIPNDGKVALVIPKEYSGYKGMATWYLTNSKTGGGLDMIINNENFSVSCLDSIPTAQSIVYKNTKEQDYVYSSSAQQQALFQKHDAMLAAMRAYPKENKLYPAFETEYKNIVNQYADFSKSLTASPLYAAQFLQIVNLTMGIGTKITTDEKEKATNINAFIVNELDFADLYTSNHWGGVINNWVQLQTAVIKDDVTLVQNTKTILNRLPTDKIYTDFVIDLTKELSKVGKDAILDELISTIKNSKRLLNYDGNLSMYQQDLTGVAPNLVITTHLGKIEDHNHSTSIIKTTELKTAYTLLLFYQSGCGHCDDAIQALKENYKKLLSNGFRILSLAADTDFAVYSNTSFSLPWADKYCDLEGTKGINFKNYAIIGTPTLFVLNKKGEILLKVASVQEVLDWMKVQ